MYKRQGHVHPLVEQVVRGAVPGRPPGGVGDDGEVELPGRQQGEVLGGGSLGTGDGDGGMAVAEGGERARQQRGAEGAQRVELGAGGAQTFADGLGVREQDAAGLGEADTAREAVEERGAPLVLQGLDLP